MGIRTKLLGEGNLGTVSEAKGGKPSRKTGWWDAGNDVADATKIAGKTQPGNSETKRLFGP
jgi:hypothetical protein